MVPATKNFLGWVMHRLLIICFTLICGCNSSNSGNNEEENSSLSHVFKSSHSALSASSTEHSSSQISSSSETNGSSSVNVSSVNSKASIVGGWNFQLIEDEADCPSELGDNNLDVAVDRLDGKMKAYTEWGLLRQVGDGEPYEFSGTLRQEKYVAQANWSMTINNEVLSGEFNIRYFDDRNLFYCERSGAFEGNREDNTMTQAFMDRKYSYLKENFVSTQPNTNSLASGSLSFGVSGRAGESWLELQGDNANQLTAHSSGLGDSFKSVAMVLEYEEKYKFVTIIRVDNHRALLSRPLHEDVENGYLYSRHTAPLGQHYTEMGYRAYAQQLLNGEVSPLDGKLLVDRFLTTDLSGPWRVIGDASMFYRNQKNPVDTKSFGYFIGSSASQLKILGTTVGDFGVYWPDIETTTNPGILTTEVAIEIGSGINYENISGEILLEGTRLDNDGLFVSELIYNEVFYPEIQKFDIPFEEYLSLKLTLRIQNISGDVLNLRVGNTTIVYGEKSDILFEEGDKILMLGDSWFDSPVYPGFKSELERSGFEVVDTVPYIYPMQNFEEIVQTTISGMTILFASEWIRELVTIEQPDYIILNYFTNDANFQSNKTFASLGARAPDGSDGTLIGLGTSNEERVISWLDHVDGIAKLCSELFVKCIFMGPAATSSFAQSIKHGEWAKELEKNALR